MINKIPVSILSVTIKKPKKYFCAKISVDLIGVGVPIIDVIPKTEKIIEIKACNLI